MVCPDHYLKTIDGRCTYPDCPHSSISPLAGPSGAQVKHVVDRGMQYKEPERAYHAMQTSGFPNGASEVLESPQDALSWIVNGTAETLDESLLVLNNELDEDIDEARKAIGIISRVRRKLHSSKILSTYSKEAIMSIAEALEVFGIRQEWSTVNQELLLMVLTDARFDQPDERTERAIIVLEKAMGREGKEVAESPAKCVEDGDRSISSFVSLTPASSEDPPPELGSPLSDGLSSALDDKWFGRSPQIEPMRKSPCPYQCRPGLDGDFYQKSDGHEQREYQCLNFVFKDDHSENGHLIPTSQLDAFGSGMNVRAAPQDSESSPRASYDQGTVHYEPTAGQTTPPQEAPRDSLFPQGSLREKIEAVAHDVARKDPGFERTVLETKTGIDATPFLHIEDPYHAYYQWRVSECEAGRGFRALGLPTSTQSKEALIQEDTNTFHAVRRIEERLADLHDHVSNLRHDTGTGGSSEHTAKNLHNLHGADALADFLAMLHPVVLMAREISQHNGDRIRIMEDRLGKTDEMEAINSAELAKLEIAIKNLKCAHHQHGAAQSLFETCMLKRMKQLEEAVIPELRDGYEAKISYLKARMETLEARVQSLDSKPPPSDPMRKRSIIEGNGVNIAFEAKPQLSQKPNDQPDRFLRSTTADLIGEEVPDELLLLGNDAKTTERARKVKEQTHAHIPRHTTRRPEMWAMGPIYEAHRDDFSIPEPFHRRQAASSANAAWDTPRAHSGDSGLTADGCIHSSPLPPRSREHGQGPKTLFNAGGPLPLLATPIGHNEPKSFFAGGHSPAPLRGFPSNGSQLPY